MTRAIFLVSSLAIVTLLGTFSDVSAQSYSSYYGNQVMCPMDAQVCADGTTVGRTGPNCQFVCPTTVTQTPACTGVYPNYCMGAIPSSYSYTSGCYTYYYNGYTRTTTITSYNCQTNSTYYPVTTYPVNTYTYPYSTTIAPSSQYYTYKYCNGSWQLSYYGNNNCSNIFNWNTGYNGYTGYYGTYNNYNYGYNNYTSNCYYVNGYQVCQ